MKPLTCTARIGAAAAAALVALGVGGALFIESGYYDIGADDHHTKVVLSLIQQLRDRSIEVRAASTLPGIPFTSTLNATGARPGGGRT